MGDGTLGGGLGFATWCSSLWFGIGVGLDFGGTGLFHMHHFDNVGLGERWVGSERGRYGG